MARIEKIPARELEISRRLREFRESTKIARTVFATTIGLGNQRLESYETGRVPLRFHVFKAIIAHFPLINLKWLVTGEGSMTLDRPFNVEAEINERALVSEVYDTTLRSYFDLLEANALSRWLKPDGLSSNLADFFDALKNPPEAKKLPAYLLEHMEQLLTAALAATTAELRKRNAAPIDSTASSPTGKRKRPRSQSST